MNRPPPFSSHSSPESNRWPNSERIIFRFTFGRKLFGFPHPRSKTFQIIFHHEKNHPVPRRIHGGSARLPGLVQLRLRKTNSLVRPCNRAASTVVSAEKTSFAEVTGQLDPGGNFFLYLGTAQWLEHLSTKVETWRTTVAAMPGITPDNTANVNKAFDIVNHLITNSGVEDITGMGLSSVEIEKGMFHNKAFLHHYPGTGNGFLWKLCGKSPHALTGLDLLPANTALAGFSDMDLPLLWKVTQDEIAKSGFPQAQDFVQKLPAQFEEKTKLKWDAVLNSFGGECGFVLTLNESNTIPIPLPGAAALTIPEPGLLLILKVNDDTIFNRIDQELKKNPQVISVEQPGLKMRTMPVPLPFIGTLRPTTASSGGYLLSHPPMNW